MTVNITQGGRFKDQEELQELESFRFSSAAHLCYSLSLGNHMISSAIWNK